MSALRELCWGLPAIVLFALVSGVAHFDPMPFGPRWLGFFFGLMLVPALGEELVFRALLVLPPDRAFPVPQLSSRCCCSCFGTHSRR